MTFGAVASVRSVAARNESEVPGFTNFSLPTLSSVSPTRAEIKIVTRSL